MNVRGIKAIVAFSLIEILISTTLALTLASLAIGAFYRVTNMVRSSQARLAMHASAQLLFNQLHRDLSATQSTCAFVAGCEIVAGGMDAGNVRIIFMRAKERNDEFGNTTTSLNYSDLVWQQILWKSASRELLIASSSGNRSFTFGSFTPAGSTNYNGQQAQTVAKPRRTLDVSDPIGATVDGLDDNVLFPSPSNHRLSIAHADDIGDFTDLERNLIPVANNVIDLTWEIICHDGTSVTINGSGPSLHVFQGVWLDGRMAPTLIGNPIYGNSAIAKRPRLLRLQFSLSDPVTDALCSFSFSFQLPALSSDG